MSKPKDQRTNVEKAVEAWPALPPDWVLVLAEECDLTSQGKVGPRIGYTGGSVVSAIINNNYKGDMSLVEDAVRGALMSATVECPVDGQITLDKCIASQKRKLLPTSNRRIRLYRACRKPCQNFRYGG